MRWSVESDQLAGSRHRKKEMLCQDSTACQMSDGRLAIALVDGIGKTDKSAWNSKEMARMISQFLLENYTDIQQSEEVVVSYNLMLQVEQQISRKSKEYEISKKELASTLLGVAIDPEAGTYCTIHLGDGAIAMQDEDDKIYLLSEPENGEWINETVLSTSEHALKHLKVHKGKIQSIQSFLLISDGIFKGYYDLKKIEEIFHRNNHHVILKENEDDQAYIEIRRTV